MRHRKEALLLIMFALLAIFILHTGTIIWYFLVHRIEPTGADGLIALAITILFSLARHDLQFNTSQKHDKSK